MNNNSYKDGTNYDNDTNTNANTNYNSRYNNKTNNKNKIDNDNNTKIFAIMIGNSAKLWS